LVLPLIDHPSILLVDIPEIDGQHLALAALLNRVAEMGAASALVAGQRVPVEASFADCRGRSGGICDKELLHRVLPLLDDLEQLTARHFTDEEAVMDAAGFPGLAEHRSEHSLLLAELKEFIRDLRSGAECLQLCHLVALKNWFVGHVVIADRHFADYYRGDHDDPGRWSAD